MLFNLQVEVPPPQSKLCASVVRATALLAFPKMESARFGDQAAFAREDNGAMITVFVMPLQLMV